MIKIENVDVCGWGAAIRGARNPMNSWDKIDSDYCAKHLTDLNECKKCQHYNADGHFCDNVPYIVGPNDKKLLQGLANAGPDHGKFLRYLIVQLDITAPFYWWKEFKTYRKGRKFMDDGDEILDPEEFEMFIETNSCSTMHKIHEKEFTLDDFSHEHLINDINECWATDIEAGPECISTPLDILECVVFALNKYREKFLETKDKRYWWQLIQLLPSSYNQRRTVQLNSQVLKSLYHARKNHKLDEWREFCSWIKTLPYSELIIDG